MAINIIETNFSFTSLTSRSKTVRLVLHHVAGTMTAAEIHALHKNVNGWAGIGYHFVIDKDGSIYRGRPIDKVGAHVTGYNTDSIGVCFNGNFEVESMSNAQKEAGKELLCYIIGLYPSITIIKKHSDLQATACPGKNFPFSEIKDGSVESSNSINVDSTENLYRVRKNWSDAASQKGAFSILNNAKALVDKNPGYQVFDAKGNVVYSVTELEVAVVLSYIVKVTASELNIRSGPGASYTVVGSIKDKGCYTIVNEENGWGKLKSGAGWISLNYTKKI